MMETAIGVVVFAMTAVVLPVGGWAVQQVMLHERVLAVYLEKLTQMAHKIDVIHKHIIKEQDIDEHRLL